MKNVNEIAELVATDCINIIDNIAESMPTIELENKFIDLVINKIKRNYD